MRVYYADPPYLGCAAKLYGDHPEAAVYDDPSAHAELMAKMDAEADAWALSLHEPSLRILLPLAPAGVRVGAWVKPFASFKPGVDPAYTWEPIIFRTGRKWSRGQPTARDHVSANITLEKGLAGAKPPAFWVFLFRALGRGPSRRVRGPIPWNGRRPSRVGPMARRPNCPPRHLPRSARRDGRMTPRRQVSMRERDAGAPPVRDARDLESSPAPRRPRARRREARERGP